MAFIGIRLPPIAATNLSEISVPGDSIPIKEMHVTLAYLGQQTSISQILRAIACCYIVAQEFAPFEMTAALIMNFPADPEGKIPIIARIVTPSIFSLRERLINLLDEYQVEYSKRHPQYKPHVTLSYAQKSIRPQIIKPVRWPAQWMTVWGGEEADELISCDIQLRGTTL